MNELELLRKQIDQIDEEIEKLFEQRMLIAKKIGEYKKEHSLNILDVSRELEVLEKARKRVKNKELEQYYIELMKYLMTLSKDYQNK